MARNQIVINVDIGETRVALVENGIVTELQIERRGDRNVVGDVYLGRVTRVLPGMNAAFVDIGLERAAFLHFEDVLSEGELRAGSLPDEGVEDGEDRMWSFAGTGESLPEVPEPPDPEDPAAAPEDPASAAENTAEASPTDGAPEGEPPVVSAEATLAGTPEAPAAPTRTPPVHSRAGDKRAAPTPAAQRPEGDRQGQRGGQGGRDRRGRDRRGRNNSNSSKKNPSQNQPQPAQTGRAQPPSAGGRPGGGGGGGHSHRGEPARKPPAMPALREGQEIVVQVSKAPISTKGARVTSHISLPGRYVVYMPTVEHVGVSKRIGNERERKRLREAIEQIKPEKGGIIVRTASEGLTKKQLKNDVAYLVHLWSDIWKKREPAKAPAPLYPELDVVLRTVRDVMGPDIEKIIIDDREAHARCVRFVEQFMPDRKDDVVFFSGSEPLFDAYGIEDEIARALSRKVPLKSGGHLILDQAEALTAIDVNSGRFVGKKDVEDTVTQTNLEAVEEIAYQLRLRNIGGLIILDLIDMDRQGNRDKVHRALNDALRLDKAKTSILRISELGLIEMTRKRTRDSLGRQLYEPCFYCDGTGNTQSKLTIAYEVLRQIRREKDGLPGYTIVVNAHPAVADSFKHEAREALEEAQRRYMRKIVVQPRPEYHIEQFDLQGR